MFRRLFLNWQHSMAELRVTHLCYRRMEVQADMSDLQSELSDIETKLMAAVASESRLRCKAICSARPL